MNLEYTGYDVGWICQASRCDLSCCFSEDSNELWVYKNSGEFID
jgi:hypothetical protein